VRSTGHISAVWFYGYDEANLLALTGDHPENPTMSLAAHGARFEPEKD
jgi:hypothetical protein